VPSADPAPLHGPASQAAFTAAQIGDLFGGHLRGLGAVPSLAGRTPSYLVRQLYDLKSGARGGRAVQPMLPVVANLTVADMGGIAAYAASLPP